MKKIGLDRIISSLPRAGDTWAIIFLAGWPFLFFWRVALGQKVFGGDDLSTLFLPAGVELARALAEGRLPLWTPDLLAGFPLFAEGHVAALYPPNLILYRVFPPQFALSYLLLLHLAWISVGAYVFARLSGFRIASALLAGLVVGFGGFALAHIQHLTLLETAAWLPWLLVFQILCLRALQEKQSNWLFWFLGASLVVALEFLSGFPQVAIINLGVFVATGTLGFWLWNRPESVGHQSGWIILTALKSLGITILCVALGVIISAVQWLPAAELLGFSVRAEEQGPSFFTTLSMKPEALTQFVFPFWKLGTPAVLNMEYWGYIGLVPLVLALTAPFLRRDIRTLSFLSLALLCLSLALGEYNPLYMLLYYVPVFNRFRVPARFLFPFCFAAAFLATAGFDAVLTRLRESRRISRVAVTGVAALAVLVLGLIAVQGAQPTEFWGKAWLLFPVIFLVAAAIIFPLAFARRLDRNQFAAGVLTLTVLDLALFAQPFLSTLDVVVTPTDLMQPPLSIRIMDTSDPFQRLFTNIYNETLRPNRLILYGKASAQLYSPLTLQRNEEYIVMQSSPMFNLLGIRYLLQPLGRWTEEFYDPTASVVLSLFEDPIKIAPTRAVEIQVTSFTDKTGSLPDGFVAGEIVLTASNHDQITLPIRIGMETADWAYEGLAAQSAIKHSKPPTALSFPGYLISVRRSFDGFKYVAHYDLPTALDITAISARSNLDEGELIIERVMFVDEAGYSTSLAPLAHRSDLSVAFRSHAVMVLENPATLPRAFVVHAAEVVNPGQTLARMREPDFRPDRSVLLSEGQPMHQTAGDDQKTTTDEVTITEYKPERVVAKAKIGQVGYLVLADTWYPGWNAWVDGQPTTIHRADYIFRAVMLQPGEHSVVFEFQPASLQWGAMISGMGMTLWVALAGVGIRRRSRDDALPH